jgi:hypothetical protein
MQPRYHIANCAKLTEMKQAGRFNRYIVAARSDGRFEVNIIANGTVRSEVMDLSVCQLCLAFIRFRGFGMSLPREERVNRVMAFSLEDFFALYPRSLHESLPRYSSDDAPVNRYSEDFEAVSRTLRESLGWRCTLCGIDLSAPDRRKWLHVHHKNGLRHDNRVQNLNSPLTMWLL